MAPASGLAGYFLGWLARVPILGPGVHKFTYDPAGNLTYDGANDYLYDGDGRICAVKSAPASGPAVMTGCIYDADGRRVAKGTISSMSCDPNLSGFQLAESYVLDTSGQELSMLDGGGNWQRTNVFGAGKQLATYDMVNNPNGTNPAQVPALHFQITDPLGTRRLQTSAVGQRETGIQSLPFGDGLATYPAPDAPTTADDATPLHYTGKERDAESGLDYFGARYYASTMGRFLSPDWNDAPDEIPYANLDDPQTLNLYSYVGNNPLGRFDPTGHDGDGVDCCTMEEIDSVVEPLVNSAEGALEKGGSLAWSTAGGIAFFLFNPQQMGNDPAERRLVMNMMAQHGKQRLDNEFSNYTDEELDAAYKDPRTSTSDREKIKQEQKRRQERRSRQSGGKKPKAAPAKNDPASVREREKANANPAPAPAPLPATTEDNSSVTTTQIDKLPKEPQDPQ